VRNVRKEELTVVFFSLAGLLFAVVAAFWLRR
jgi:hypothetical protein